LTAVCDLLYASIVLWNAPLTSLGRQSVTLPFAPFAAAGVNTFAFDFEGVAAEVDDPPPALSPPPPQPVSTPMQLAATIQALAVIVSSSLPRGSGHRPDAELP
jgi:hypothetical protein